VVIKNCYNKIFVPGEQTGWTFKNLKSSLKELLVRDPKRRGSCEASLKDIAKIFTLTLQDPSEARMQQCLGIVLPASIKEGERKLNPPEQGKS